VCVCVCVCVLCVRLIFDKFQLSSQFVDFHKTGWKNATIPHPVVFNFLQSVITTWRMCELVRRKWDKRQPHFCWFNIPVLKRNNDPNNSLFVLYTHTVPAFTQRKKCVETRTICLWHIHMGNWDETNRNGSKFVGDFSFFITLSACIFGLIIQQAIAFMWRACYV